MMLTRLGPLGSGRCRCLTSLPFRIRGRRAFYNTTGVFRVEECSPKLSSNTNASVRLLSNVSNNPPPRTNRRHFNKKNSRRCENIGRIHVQNLMDDSKAMMKFHKTLDASHRESKLQQLLVGWGPVIKFLSDGRNNPNELHQAVTYADGLANIYLDILVEATTADTNRNRTSAATHVNPAIHGWAKIQRLDPHCDAASRAEHLLKRLLECFEMTQNAFFRPRLHTFNGVLDALSKSASKDAPEKAREWLEKMKSNETYVSPDRISFNSVLNAYASRGDAVQAVALFDEMRQHPTRGLHPDTYSYNMLMKAWQRSGSDMAANATLGLLEDFKRACKRHYGKGLYLKPNTSVYSIPMSMANAETAHKLLDEMLEWHERNPRAGMQPRTYHFAMVMNAYAKRGEPAKAEQVFLQMMQLNREGSSNVQPTLQSFTILIKAWCKEQTPKSIARAEALLEEMEELFLDGGPPLFERMNTYAYNSVMNAHVRLGGKGSAKRVEELFERMIVLGESHKNPAMLPDKISYTTMMKAWIQEQEPDYAERVEELLRKMTNAFEKEGIEALRPDVVSYGCAIDAWSRSGEADAAFRAEALLREMERKSEKGDATLRPNDFCFNSIINAHSKAGDAPQAESVLRMMEDSYRAGNKRAKPDAVTYTSCIDAWSRSIPSSNHDPVSKSQKLFETMVHGFQQGDVSIKPTAATYTALMMVLANNASPDIARIAKENLRIMREDLDVDLNTIAYNALIHTCSCATAAKRDALELAITSFHNMKKKGIPLNAITYNSLLHVVHNLVEEGEDARQRALEDVFHQCQQDGMVNDVILATMQRFGLPTTMKHLMNDENKKQ